MTLKPLNMNIDHILNVLRAQLRPDTPVWGSLHIWGLGIAFLASILVYTISLVVYRVFLSPLANFPGPRLAAATAWYETFFDLWTNNFPAQLDELHNIYGIFTLIYSIPLPLNSRLRNFEGQL